MSVVLLVVATVAIFPVIGDDNDIWFHLAYGKQYITHFTWRIDQTQFSWTPVDVSNWIYGTWLGSSLMYLVHELGGIGGLYIMQWFILILTLLMMVQYARLLKDRLDMFRLMSLMLIFIVLKLTQVYLKPQLISTLLFSITVFIYYFSIQLQYQKSRCYYLYPIIFLLWVNIHGEFMVGLAFLGLALTGELIAAAIDKNYDKFRHVLVPFGASVVLSYVVILINPDGLKYPVSILKMWVMQPDAASQANISVQNMWHSVGFSAQNFNFVNAADAILLMGSIYVVFCLAAIYKTRRINIPMLLINIAFFYLSMNAARATLFFPIVWSYSMYTLMSESNLWEIKQKLAPLFMGIFTFAAVYSLYLMLITMPYATWMGYRFDDYIPKKAVDFIKRYRLPGPVFNDYLHGGYMMWAMYPEYKVWIDPRSGPYIKEVLPDWLRITGNLNDDNFKYLTTKYPFKIALIGMWRCDVIFWLLKSPDWKLIYFDSTAAVLIHKSVIPGLPPAALDADVGTMRFVDIDNPTILSNLFQFYILVGPAYARDIRNIFEHNVSNWLQGKKEKLAYMDAVIQQKEVELLKKQQAAEGK
ncbi:MAG: hypothetical protein HY881_12095 [Deltaproteobacteria bacterium]|nr:hypothetical protein [Deltaproteobacteria bacterium]